LVAECFEWASEDRGAHAGEPMLLKRNT
jgi:hypothetical protein